MSEGDQTGDQSGKQRDPTQLICPKCHHELSEASPYCPNDHAISGGVHAVTIGAITKTPRARRHLLGVTISDAYVINGYLGSGGFGAVYRAEQKALARDVAIKLLMVDHEVDPAIVDRFKREARTAAALLDPNIVTLFDYGEAELGGGTEDEDRVLYFVMELVQGPTLRQYLKARKGRGAGLEASLAMSLNILRGLSAAHQLGVVHRDLKPGNVLIDESKGRRHFARLFDFGIASLTGSGGHTTAMGAGGVVGTPKYMAPEQWRAQQTAPCTDVYAFGAILAEMLSGEPPVPKAELVEMATAHCRNPRPNITMTPRGESVSRPLTNFVKKCMAIDPRQRYGNAREALNVLEAIIESGERAPIPTVTNFPVPGSGDFSDRSISADMSLSQGPGEPPPPPASHTTGPQRPVPQSGPPPFDLASRAPERLSAPVPASNPPPIVASTPPPERLTPPRRWAIGIGIALLVCVLLALIIGLSGPDPLDPMAAEAGVTAASTAPPTAPPSAPPTAPPTEAPKDAGRPDAALAPKDAGRPDASTPDAAVPDAAPSAAITEPPKPRRVVRPKIVKAPPSAPPTAPPTAAAVARRQVGGYDVTPESNLTATDRATALRDYNRGVDAQKRGAPKSALRFLVKSLKSGLEGSTARDAQRRIQQIVDRATLEGQKF